MDLTATLLRVGARRPHVLVVPVPGLPQVRLATEAELARRGWPVATGPADTDLLVTAGRPGPRLAEVVEQVWARVPAPRARVQVTDPATVPASLDGAVAELGDVAAQRRTVPGAPPQDRQAAEHEAADGSGHRHGHGDSGMPGGLPMADLGEDRDGLTLDRLHVPLGPVLPDWPAGLVLHLTLQGDVIQDATAELLDDPAAPPSPPPPEPVARAVARELDALARLLGVAGWDDLAARSRRVRDEFLAGATDTGVHTRATAVTRRVRRSRTLRWLIRGVAAGPVDVAEVLEHRLTAVERALAGRPPSGHRPQAAITELPALLVGAEFAAARLIVAALDPDTDLRPADHGRGDGHG